MASRSSVLALASLALAVLAGCSSTPKYDAASDAAAKAERPVAMRGTAAFFEGKVETTLTVSRGFGRTGPGSGRKGKGMERTDPVADISGMEDEEAMAYIRGRAAMGAPMPPVTLRLHVANKTAEALDVEILEVNSDLGNFAVRPAKLSIATAQEGEPDPMFSQLGVTSDEILVKVTLRVGGKKESQTLAVKTIIQPSSKK